MIFIRATIIYFPCIPVWEEFKSFSILHSTQTRSYLEKGTLEDVNGIQYNIARDRNFCATGQSQDTVIEAKLGV